AARRPIRCSNCLTRLAFEAIRIELFPGVLMNHSSVNGVGRHTADALRPSEIFRGKRLVVVGGTGFLGKVWVSMFLHRFPEVEHVYLLVRPKDNQTPEERFWAQIAPSAVFDPLREKYPGGELEAFLKAKVTPVAGDVVEPLCGLAPELLDALAGSIA